MAQGPRQVMPLGGCGQPALSPAPHAPDRLLHLQQYLPESRWFPRGSAPPWASVRTTLALRSRRSSSVSLCPNQSSRSRRCVRGAPCGQNGARGPLRTHRRLRRVCGGGTDGSVALACACSNVTPVRRPTAQRVYSRARLLP